MSSRAAVELDFFGMEKEARYQNHHHHFNRQRSFRGISKINPEVLKTVIASGSASNLPNEKPAEMFSGFGSRMAFSVPSTPTGDLFSFHSLPVYTPIFRTWSEAPAETAPMTIFYNGTVSVFDLPRDKAEGILKLAAGGSSDPTPTVPSADQEPFLDSLDGDLPIARRKSIRRFLEKRRERLTAASPYACQTQYAFSEQKQSTMELL